MIARLLTLAVALLASGRTGPVVAGGEQPQFSTRVEGVRVDVLVTSDNRPVIGLTTRDFEVRDNGVAQTIELVSLQQLPLNLVLAFDLSVSVEGDRLTRLRRASDALLRTVKKDDRIGLVTFNQAITMRCELSPDVQCVHDALAAVQPSGETSLIDGTYAAMILGESEPGRSLVMAFSDRFDTASFLSAARVLDSARRSEVVVHGITPVQGQSRFLRDLTDMTGGRILRGDAGEDLAAVFVKILDEFRQRYVLTYTPKGVQAAGWHELSVRVKRRASVKARPGYLVDPK